jgi:phage head maturation protease
VPWRIEKREDEFCVIKESDGSTEKCHDSEEKAKAHMQALYASEDVEGRASVDTSAWDGNAAMSSAKTAADYRAICAGEHTEGEPDERRHWALPHHTRPGAPPNAAGVRNALSRFPQTQGLKDAGAARRHLEAHMASIRAESENRAPELRAPVESRAAAVEGVDFPQRMIEVLAVPYEQEALVEYRGEIWRESFERGAFDGIEKRPNRVKAFRDHAAGAHMRGTSTSGLIGRVVSFAPERPEGLVGHVKIAKTPLGDETLSLADEGILGVSVGFGVRGSDQVLDRTEQRRRIRRAFVDHLAFPDNGAYEDAQVIDVRRERPQAADLPKLDTPRLDEIVAWLESRR